MATAAELAILIKAEGADKAKKELGGVGDAAGGIKGAIGGAVGALGSLGLAGLGVGVVTGAVSAAAGAVGDLIGKAEALADAQARVNLVWGEGSRSARGLAADAAEQANALGMTREEYLSNAGALGQLATSLGVSQEAAEDMAGDFTELAPKLAAYAGVEGEVASDALEKALMGKTRGLAALGIAITDADAAAAAMRLGIQGEAKDWTEAEKAQINYAAVMDKTGAAQAAWADNQGDVEVSMQRITKAMDDAKATIGEKLLPAIAPLLESLADKLPGAIQFVTDGLDKMGPAFDTISGLVGGLVDFLKPLVEKYLDVLGKELEFIGSVIGPVIEGFQSLFDGMSGGTSIIDNIKNALSSMGLDSIAAQLDSVLNELGPTLETVKIWFDSMVSRVRQILAGLVGFIQEHWDEISAIIDAAVLVIRGMIEFTFNLISGIIRTVMALIRGDWEGAWEAIKDTLRGAMSGIQKILEGLFTIIGTIINGVINKAKEVGKGIIDGIKQGITDGWNALKDWIVQKMQDIINGVLSIFGIESPSKVFRDIGINIMEGMRLGIFSGAPRVQAALADVAAAMMDWEDFAAQWKAQAEKAFGASGLWDEIRKLWEEPGRGMASADLAIAAGKITMPDWRLMTGSPEEAKKEWGKFWEAVRKFEDERHSRTMAEIGREEKRLKNNPMALEHLEQQTEAENAKHQLIMDSMDAEMTAASAFWDRADAFEKRRQEAIKAATEAIKEQQRIEEQYADSVHDLLMGHIQAELESREQQHKARLAAIENEQAREDRAHEGAMSAIEAEERAIREAEAARKEFIDDMKLALEGLRIDLGIDAAMTELERLRERVSEFYDLMGDLEEQATGSDATKRAREEAAKRLKLRTDEQRAAVREALAGNRIVDDDLRRQAQLWAAGHAIRAKDADAIIKVIGRSLDEEATGQQKVVDGLQARVDAREAEIAAAERLFTLEQDANEDRLAELDARKEAEDSRHAVVMANIEAAEAAEKGKWDAYKAAVDDAIDQEAARHAAKMAALEQEFRYQLLILGVGQEEADRIIAEERARAHTAAEEAMRMWMGISNAIAGTAKDAYDATRKVFYVIKDDITNALVGAVGVLDQLKAGFADNTAGAIALKDATKQFIDLWRGFTEEDEKKGKRAAGKTTRQGRGGFRFSSDEAWWQWHYGGGGGGAGDSGPGGGGFTIQPKLQIGRADITSAGAVTITAPQVVVPEFRAEITTTIQPIITIGEKTIEALAVIIDKRLAERAAVGVP